MGIRGALDKAVTSSHRIRRALELAQVLDKVYFEIDFRLVWHLIALSINLVILSVYQSNIKRSLK